MTPLSREQQLELDRNAAIKEAAAVTQEKKDLQKYLDYVIEEWNQSDAALCQQVAEMTQKYYEAGDERSRIIESDHLYKFVARERDQLAQQVATLKTGACLKCHMGPLRESCAYPEACEHPGRALALKLNRTLLDLADSQATVMRLEREAVTVTSTEATAAIQRYTYRPGVYDTRIHDFRPGMEPNDQGDWVRHIDLIQALAHGAREEET